MVDLIEALETRGVQCHAIVPYRGSLLDAFDAKRVPYSISYFRPWCWSAGQPLWDRVLKKPVVHVVRAIGLARIVRATRCDVVITNTSTVCEGAIAARILGIPHVTHVREYGDPGYGLDYELGMGFSMRVLSALSKRVVFNSRTLAAHFIRQVPPVRARVVYNAVLVPEIGGTPESAPARPDRSFVCLLVGNVVRAKGHEDAIRALGELARRGRDVQLRFLGRPHAEEDRRLDALIHALGLGDRVERVGHSANPFPYYLEADAVLVCSRKEAFGRVAIEAMKLGRAVIAASAGGAPEQIQDGFNGKLYPPGDFVALADKIDDLMRDPEAALNMAARAKAWSTQTFTLDRYGAEMLKVLEEAIR
jgi:glycosyltransferase involved in cell wall biosynthesis